MLTIDPFCSYSFPYTPGKFFPVPWKQFSPDPWHRYGYQNGSRLANIFMALIEEEIIRQSKAKPREWKRYIDEIFSVWDYTKQEIYLFIEQANNFHPTIKFTAEISEIKTTFQDTIIYKGDRFRNDSVLDIRTHCKPTETFQYTHFTSCHSPGVKRGFMKGEALRLLRTNSSETMFEDNLS